VLFRIHDHIGLAQKNELLTVPALFIKDKSYRSILSAGEILAALDAPA
jgi:hypothetical protein